MSHALPVDTGETCQPSKVLLSRMLPRNKPPQTHLTLPFWGKVKLHSKLESNTFSRETKVLERELNEKQVFVSFHVCQLGNNYKQTTVFGPPMNTHIHIQKL